MKYQIDIFIKDQFIWMMENSEYHQENFSIDIDNTRNTLSCCIAESYFGDVIICISFRNRTIDTSLLPKGVEWNQSDISKPGVLRISTQFIRSGDLYKQLEIQTISVWKCKLRNFLKFFHLL